MSNAADRLLSVMDSRSRGVGSGIASGLSYGTVTSASPLVITRDDGAAFTAGFLVLSRSCRALSVQIQGETVQLWSGLSVGEKVILLSFNSGQRHFVERL